MRRNKNISIFNDVLGPIMRGPSSSHTAGPYHIGLIARALLGISEEEIQSEILRRYDIMKNAAREGLNNLSNNL